MQSFRIFASVALAITLHLIPQMLWASPTVDEIVQYHIAFRTFSDLHNAVRTGYYDLFSSVDVAESLFRSECGFSEPERDALLTQLHIRTGASDGSGDLGVTAVLLDRFRRLKDHALRARVLSAGVGSGLPGFRDAIHGSALSLALMLKGQGTTPVTAGYEVEAVTLASVAVGFPSNALAELLRTIASHSRDRRVVAAARESALSILVVLGGSEDGSI